MYDQTAERSARPTGRPNFTGEVACFAAQAQYTRMRDVLADSRRRVRASHGDPSRHTRLHLPEGFHGTFSLYRAGRTRSFIYIDNALRAVVVYPEQALGEVRRC